MAGVLGEIANFIIESDFPLQKLPGPHVQNVVTAFFAKIIPGYQRGKWIFCQKD
jgi:hypothetical protein